MTDRRLAQELDAVCLAAEAMGHTHLPVSLLRDIAARLGGLHAVADAIGDLAQDAPTSLNAWREEHR